MSFEGTIVNGTVVPDEPTGLAEGTRVEFVVKKPEPEKPTLLGLMKLAGVIKDAPPDWAAEHDHYIHGTPKRSQSENP